MNFGLLMSFRNSSRGELSYADLYRKHVDLCVEAEDLGFDTIWLTEHHFVDDGYSPSMIPLAAAIAARTKKIRIGTFVLLMPLHNPLHVAEDAATIDVLSNGRFDLGLGQGYVPREFAGFNVPREERSKRLREGVEIVRRAFTEDNFTFEGKCYSVRDVTLYPKPVSNPILRYGLERDRDPQRTRRPQWIPSGGYRCATGGDLSRSVARSGTQSR